MSHQLRRQLTSEKERSEVESSFSPSLITSLHLHSQAFDNNLHDLHNQSSTSPTTTTNTKVDAHYRLPFKLKRHFPFFRRDFGTTRRLFDVSCACFGIWLSKRRERKLKQSRFEPMSSAMATTTANEVIPRGPSEFGEKFLGGQHKREELQREVSVLEKMLSHEEKIREILQQAYNRRPGMEFSIPNHLPPKTKEVLAELVLVEDEIARLETQIEQIQKNTKSEQEATKQLRAKQQSSLQNTSSTTSRGNLEGTNYNHHDHQQQTAYGNKALHFISKAINGGGYSLTDFTISNNDDKVGSLSAMVAHSPPYVQNHMDSSGMKDRVIAKRSGMLKPSASPLREFRHPPASPLRDFRHPTPKPQERSNNTEFRAELPRKALSGPAKIEESSGTKCQPNKLSENIMKTLLLLYVRLIRTSRQSELEKSGPVSRSLYSSMSFRNEPGVSLSTSLVLQKESKQQDPYGVFDIEGAVPRDIGPYKNLVVFSSSSLDPKYVSHSSSIPLFQKLRGLLSSLQKVELRSLTDQQKLAFWINIYNACIMNGYLKFGVPSSTDKLFSLLNKATLNVGGKTVNAQAIERCILRKPTPPSTMSEIEMDSKEVIIHELYGLGAVNPNVTFGLCCGTRSSPAVRIYTAEGVTTELEKSKLEYLLASISVTTSKKIWLPELLVQNMPDFATDMDSLVEWVCHQLPTSGSLRKSIVDCFRGLNSNNSGRISTSVINVEKMSYEFELKYLLQV